MHDTFLISSIYYIALASTKGELGVMSLPMSLSVFGVGITSATLKGMIEELRQICLTQRMKEQVKQWSFQGRQRLPSQGRSLKSSCRRQRKIRSLASHLAVLWATKARVSMLLCMRYNH